MRTLAKSQLHLGTKRSGASVSMYACAERQGQPRNFVIAAGSLPTDWEEAGP